MLSSSAMLFDELADRSSIPASRWNPSSLVEHFGTDDVLPLWIADMDFRAPPPVVKALVDRASLGIFAYEYRAEGLFDAIRSWYHERHGWPIEREHLQVCPSVMNAISSLIQLVTEPGDRVIVQPPVFFEFRQAIRRNDRETVKNPLRLVDGRYVMDLDALDEAAADPRTKMLILCNPIIR